MSANEWSSEIAEIRRRQALAGEMGGADRVARQGARGTLTVRERIAALLGDGSVREKMALPLRVGRRVIGALDVQSTQSNAFTDDDIATLTTLADQIALAIENARLFSEAREALTESEETFGRYIRQEWRSFAQQARSAGYLYDGKRTIPVDERDKQEKSRSLPQTGRLPLEKDTRELVVPIRLRGQTIRFLDVKSKSGNRKWTPDDLTLLEAAAERAALALESARLVDSSQRRASRERTIGEISTKIGSVSNMDAIMQAAVDLSTLVLSARKAWGGLTAFFSGASPASSLRSLRTIPCGLWTGKGQRAAESSSPWTKPPTP